MGKDSTKQTAPAPSKLEQFSLGFEWDKTLREVKHDVRQRTDRTA